jgi:hypothetical protein
VEAAKGFLAVLRDYLDTQCSNLRSHTITNVQSNNDKVFYSAVSEIWILIVAVFGYMTKLILRYNMTRKAYIFPLS